MAAAEAKGKADQEGETNSAVLMTEAKTAGERTTGEQKKTDEEAPVVGVPASALVLFCVCFHYLPLLTNNVESANLSGVAPTTNCLRSPLSWGLKLKSGGEYLR
jgi:hypothetical protein